MRSLAIFVAGIALCFAITHLWERHDAKALLGQRVRIRETARDPYWQGAVGIVVAAAPRGAGFDVSVRIDRRRRDEQPLLDNARPIVMFRANEIVPLSQHGERGSTEYPGLR